MGLKVPKVRFLGFGKNDIHLAQSANVFFVLFAKTTCLRYEVEFLDMIRGPRKH